MQCILWNLHFTKFRKRLFDELFLSFIDCTENILIFKLMAINLLVQNWLELLMCSPTTYVNTWIIQGPMVTWTSGISMHLARRSLSQNSGYCSLAYRYFPTINTRLWIIQWRNWLCGWVVCTQVSTGPGQPTVLVGVILIFSFDVLLPSKIAKCLKTKSRTSRLMVPLGLWLRECLYKEYLLWVKTRFALRQVGLFLAVNVVPHK